MAHIINNLSLLDNNTQTLGANLNKYIIGDLINNNNHHHLSPHKLINNSHPNVHVVAIPYPAQGHTVPLMQLCKQLASLGGFTITFVNTEHIHTRMLQAASHSVDNSPRGKPPLSLSQGNIRLVSIPGGLPPELHGEAAHVVAALEASEALSSPFDDLLHKLNLEGPPVTHIISDAMLSWTQASADALGVPRLAFWTSSAACFFVIWHMYHLAILHNFPSLKAALQEGINKTDNMVSWIPGLPPVHIDDLPAILQSDPSDFVYQFMMRQLESLTRAACILINTIYELEDDIMSALQGMAPTPPILAIGPLLPPTLLDAIGMTNCKPTSPSAYPDGKVSVTVCEGFKLTKTPASGVGVGVGVGAGVAAAAAAPIIKMRTCKPVLKQCNPSIAASRGIRSRRLGVNDAYSRLGGSIFGEDTGCLRWLDDQSPGSVLYISFGSLYRMGEAQFKELAAGVEASGAAFLWSIRPDFVEEGSYADKLPASFLERTKERGMMLSWVPQLEVLSHPSIGGFLTHCGWNSMLESVCMGVPLLCWPDAGERRTNGLLAINMWHTGLDFTLPEDSLSGQVISKCEVKRVVKLLMGGGHSADVHVNAHALRHTALLSLSKGGSSSLAFRLLLSHMSHHINEVTMES